MTTTETKPEFTAKHRYARITARKARLIADVIRGLSVNDALERLEYAPQRAAAFYKKVVRPAMANASQDESVNVNRLVISEAIRPELVKLHFDDLHSHDQLVYAWNQLYAGTIVVLFLFDLWRRCVLVGPTAESSPVPRLRVARARH